MAMNKMFLRLALMVALVAACSPTPAEASPAMIVEVQTAPTTTCASSGYIGTQLLWCVKICESGLTGKALDNWIHRWIRQYRQLPYCLLD